MDVPEVVLLVLAPNPPPPKVLLLWLFWPKPPPPNPKDMLEMVGVAMAVPGAVGCEGCDDQGREGRGSRARRVKVTKARQDEAQVAVNNRRIVLGRDAGVGRRVSRAITAGARALLCSEGGWGEVEVGTGGSFFLQLQGNMRKADVQ